jgi:hypothetical protein
VEEIDKLVMWSAFAMLSLDKEGLARLESGDFTAFKGVNQHLHRPSEQLSSFAEIVPAAEARMLVALAANVVAGTWSAVMCWRQRFAAPHPCGGSGAGPPGH